MRTRLLLAIGAFVAIAIAAFSTAAAGPGAGVPISRLANESGTAVTPSDKLRTSGIVELRLIGRVSGRAFYRALAADGRNCLGFGSAEKIGDPGLLMCGIEDVPSTARPVLAFPDVGATRSAPGKWELFRVDGFVADEVARVVATNANGEVVAEAAVTGNVFSLIPREPTDVGDVIAFDEAGNKIFSQSYRPGS